HGDWSAASNLLAKQWHNASVRSEDVPETAGGEPASAVLETLHDELGHALGAAHAARRPDGLVRRHQDELVRARGNRRPRHVARAEEVVARCLDGIRLGEGHVFVGSCMNAERWSMRREYGGELVWKQHVAPSTDEVE